MVIFLALCTTILAYALIETVLSSVLSERIRLEQRLSETRQLAQGEEYETEESVSVLARLMRPVYNRFLDLFTLVVTKDPEQLKKTEAMLQSAGVRMSPRDYRASVIMTICIMTVLGAGYLKILGQPPKNILLGALFGAYAGFTLTRFSLTGKIKRRKQAIYHALPEMMDLLHVSVSAGLGFDQAITYIVQKSKGPLYEELATTQREIMLGRSRREALTNFAVRCDNMEIRTFVTAVIQADEMGSSLSNVLLIQSETIRDTHKQAVEEQAQKLSVKILVPMVIFVFPVMFIILMGPAVLSIMASGAF